ncbi:MAG: hypothetical protein HY777_09080 [Betaproteobacteria bacterium]|nr:hypothetical protein [Betaproteobacteria bacterium]
MLRFGGEATRKVQEKKDRWEAAIAGAEREVLEAFLSLPAPQKKVAREVILALVKANAPSASER